MKKYMVYVNDRRNYSKLAIPAETEVDVMTYVKGNGNVIAVKDVTENYPISAEKVVEALDKAGFGVFERDFIIRALQQTDIV